tara:strand:+ start:12899 stop:13879 length:981 start_codon:yes stop_codon:yes gene_type:complete
MKGLKGLLILVFINSCGVVLSEEQMKTWFGDPDLQGTWTNASLTTLERPDQFKSLVVSEEQATRAEVTSAAFTEAIDNPYEEGETPKAGENVGGYNTAWMDPGTKLFKINGEYRSSILTYPEDGKLPRRWVRWGVEGPSIYRMFSQANHPEERSLGERCLVGFGSSGGPPMLNVLYNNHYQIVQSPGYVMILVEMNHDARIIRLKGNHLPDHIRPWLGDSVGHWEGNTLVVKTKNHHLQQRFRAAIRHQILITEDAEITERFTRISEDEILYQFEVDDNVAYKDSWKGEMPLREAEGKIYEYACHEGNYAMANILAGAREEERRNQ